MPPLVLKHTAAAEDAGRVCDFLARHSGLPKARIKDAMIKGAVWLTRPRAGRRRLRRAVTPLAPGDVLELHYDPEVLALAPPPPTCLLDQGRYSVWYKPPGLLTQGTDFGDHCTLLRQVELRLERTREVFAVHRLDREAAGLVLVAHDREAAARLSKLFREQAVQKRYRVAVRGNPGRSLPGGLIDLPLDGRPALTRFRLERYDDERDTALLEVRTATGRKHQIRRHLDLVGHPVLGDPRYGSGNKNRTGLQLAAVGLAFPCPFTGKEVLVDLPPGEPAAAAYAPPPLPNGASAP